jgi:hypothetical protein
MTEEKISIIKYQGSQIALFSDNRNDYINLTNMAKAYKSRKSILSWIRNNQTIEFLNVWEKKYNPLYDGAQMSTVLKLIKERNLSIKQWVELTNAKGILTRVGEFAGTYAHKDIAFRLAGWLSPEFEFYIVEEFQKLKELERQKYSLELLDHDQIIALIRLKEVFKYVSHQTIIEDAHKEVFASKSSAKNPFGEFNTWRNEALNISPDIIEERIKQYCAINKIAVTKKMLNKPKREKILIIDSYESVRNAVWDFLQIKEEVNALNLANLVEEIIRIEKGEVLRVNEDNLFDTKQLLGEFSDFKKLVDEMPEIKTARQLLELRVTPKKKITEVKGFSRLLKATISVPPEIKKAMDEGENIP